MLRITENAENGKTVRLRLDGTVNSASYAELEAACSRHQESAGKSHLGRHGGGRIHEQRSRK